MGRKPKRGEQIITPIPQEQISFDVEAFDDLILSQGVTMVHYRAMRCPIGLTDRNDVHHPQSEDHECSNGFLYKKAGEMTGYFQSNTSKPVHINEGILDTSQVAFTPPRYYNGTKKSIVLLPYDRVFLKDCEARVANWEAVNSSATGVDRLQYPVFDVEHLIDSRGIEYRKTKDFKILKGNIVWISGRSPGVDADSGKGVVYSIRYRYQPHWYIKELVHEIRVAQVTDENDFSGERSVQRLPYMAILQREYIFLSNQRTKKEKARSAREPEDGGNLGPR